MSVLIIGDLILDINYHGICNRIAPEAPIPITKINYLDYNLGGALNVANNLTSMGINVNIIGIIGNDENGNHLKNVLKLKNINSGHIIIDITRPTTTKNRIFCNNKLVSRFDIETTNDINDELMNQVINNLNKIIDAIDIIILSDYMKGVLTEKITKIIINICRNKNKKIFVDPKDVNYTKYNGCTMIKPNKNEAEKILDYSLDFNNLEKNMFEIKRITNAEICLLTLGEKGCAILTDNNEYAYYPGIQRNVIDVTGAGDTVLASFTYYYLLHNDMIIATDFANYCGNVKITHVGAYAITKLDIINYKKNKVITKSELDDLIPIFKNQNNIIVFTCGCFDILHYGHISYLESAKKYGNILIVGLNSDNSIKLTKGSTRPINKLEYRIKQLEVLNCIDFIIVFDELSPIDLIKQIKPNFLIKGGDYKPENVFGKEYAEKTLCINYIDGLSTSNIINSLLARV